MTVSMNFLRSTPWLRRSKDGAGRRHSDKEGLARTIEVYLGSHDLYRLSGDQRGSEITAVRGRLWITQENQADDVVLSPGETFTIAQRGLVLVQGLAQAEFRLNYY